jgi:capsular exopolysaccharide synthesis family protein
MAQAGFKVVIVDADLRRPIQDQIFSVSNDTGLSDVILADNPVGKEVLQTTNIENLRLLTAGPMLPNPYKLIESARMKTIIQQLQDESDIVLLDSPPALMVTDAAILGTEVDGTLIVVEAGHTRSADTRRAVDELKRLHVHLIGVILNRTSYNQNNHYYSYYRKNGHEKRSKAPQDQGITQNASVVGNKGKKQRKSKELN